LRRRRARDAFRAHEAFRFERAQIRQDLARGRGPQASVHVRVDVLDQCRDGVGALAQRVDDLPFARFAVADVLVQLRAHVAHLWAVTAVDRVRIAVLVAQAVQRALVRTHVTTRRRNDHRAGADDDVPGEQRAFVFEHEHQMVARVARRVQHRERRIIEREPFALGERAVVRKPCFQMRVHRRARRRSERRGAGKMIRMPMRHHDRRVARVGITRSRQKGVSLRVVDRAGIDRHE